MSKFRQWYTVNAVEITWFLIGILLASSVVDFVSGDYFWGTVNLALAYINYIFRPIN